MQSGIVELLPGGDAQAGPGPDLAGTDLRVVDDVAIRRLPTETCTEALRDGAAGWVDDVLALRRPWGFDLSAITSPVLLWHGAKDTFSPVTHAYWLARQIPAAVIKAQKDAAHVGAVEILPSVLAWIKEIAVQKGCRSRTCSSLPSSRSVLMCG